MSRAGAFVLALGAWAAGLRAEEGASLRALYSRPPAEWPAPQVKPAVAFHEIAPLPAPLPHDPAKAELGAALFFDPRLSGSQQMSCASCHDPELAWADGRSLPAGHHRRPLRRNTPSLLNVARQPYFFWDGRALSLEELVLEVITDRDEMHGDLGEVCGRLGELDFYRSRFEEAFGSPEVSPERVAAAVAEFVKTIQSRGRARFDRFVAGQHDLLSDQEILGLHLFRTKAGCVNCHHGPFFTDHQFHDLGLSYFGRELQDLGRYHATGNPADSGKFKTPSLRNVTRTAPYMHVGLFPLEGVLNLYNAGMPSLRPKPGQETDPLFPQKSPLLEPLQLTVEEREAIIAFLRTLEEPPQRVRRSLFPPVEEPGAAAAPARAD